MSILLQTDALLFVGRFHPLAVHLPIGFLLLAAIFFTLSLFKSYRHLLKALPITLFFGAASSVVAATLGWLLSKEGGYQENTLQWHQWMGISVTIISIISWIWISNIKLKKEPRKDYSQNLKEENDQRINANQRYVGLVMTLLFLLIAFTGHLGGNLTHGDQYLIEYAPSFIQTLLTEKNKTATQKVFPSDPDSILIYTHLIQPILDKKCISCHNENKMKGGLILSTPEGLLKGGDNGIVLEKGSSQNSELFKRVSHDPSSKKFMPPKGTPMSYTEIALLNFWINSGMSFELTVTDENLPEDIQQLIEQDYSLSTKKKSFLEKTKVSAVPNDVMESLVAQGFQIKTVSTNNNFVEVIGVNALTKEKIEALLIIKDQITWLDLSNANLQDSWLSPLSQFVNLTRLKLDNNNITDSGLVHLKSLKHLEVINLHATQVSDQGINQLAEINSLRRIYAWKTNVTLLMADSIRKENPALFVDLGQISN